MVAACLLRNLDDLTGLFRISQRQMEDMGSAALSLFIVMALMTLKLWELVHLALPLCVILGAQLLLIAVLSLVVHRCLGGDTNRRSPPAGSADSCSAPPPMRWPT